MGPPVAVIDREAIRHNLALVRTAIGPGVRLCPAVKANAYGHGIAVVLPVFREARVDMLAVATLDEAIELRRLHWTGPVLVFGRPVQGATGREMRELAGVAVRYGLTCTIGSRDEVLALTAAATRMGRCAVVHIKLDSGMGRAGLRPDDAEAVFRAVREMVPPPGLRPPAGASRGMPAPESAEQLSPGIRVEGVYTHFASADEADLAFTGEQEEVFRRFVAGPAAPLRHAANTAAIFRVPSSHFDMVRPGVGVYGYWPDPNVASPVPLRPCLRLVGRVAAVKRVGKGQSVGYGRTFTTQRESTLGIVPIGYADGYPRSLGNRAVMTLQPDGGERLAAPVVGRVSMDQTVVDLTDVPGAKEGDPITIIDNDPAAPNSVAAIARLLGTIPYEVTCGLGRRIQRVPGAEG